MKDYQKIHKSLRATTSCVNGVVTTSEQLSNRWFEKFDVITDQLNGDFHTNYSHSFTKQAGNSYFDGSIVGWKSSLNYSIIGGATSRVYTRTGTAGYSTAAYNKCLSRLYEGLRGGIDVSVDLVQHRQTREMVGGLYKNLFRAEQIADNLIAAGKWTKSLNWRQAVRLLSGKWLEYAYGIKPTAQTVFDLLHREMQPDNTVIKLEAHASDNYVETIDAAAEGGTTVRDRGSILYKRRCMAEVEFKIANARLLNLSAYSSLNPVSLAWETLPFSFVVDWIYDIGGYIRNLESAMISGTYPASGWIVQGYRIQSSVSRTGANFYPSQPSWYDLYDLSGSHMLSGKSRMPFAAGTKPLPPTVTNPFKGYPTDQDPNRGLTRLMNAASLLAQKLNRY